MDDKETESIPNLPQYTDLEIKQLNEMNIDTNPNPEEEPPFNIYDTTVLLHYESQEPLMMPLQCTEQGDVPTPPFFEFGKAALMVPAIKQFISGLFDGDGCISVSKNGKITCSLSQTSVNSRRPSVLLWLHSVLNGLMFKKNSKMDTRNSIRFRSQKNQTYWFC